MADGIRGSNPSEFNKGRDSKFRIGARVRQETSEEGQRTHRPKRWQYNNKDEDNNSYILNDKKQSYKFCNAITVI